VGIIGVDKACGRPHSVEGLQMYRILKSVVGCFRLDSILLIKGSSILIYAGSKFTSRPASLLIPNRASLFVLIGFTVSPRK
jgi:hypothetical protein